MKRIGLAMVAVLSGLGLLGVVFWNRVAVRESGHGFVAGDYLVLGEYGYSDGGDRLRYAIFRTWPKDSTPAQRAIDNRTARSFLGRPLIRDKDGRMIPVGSDGDIYFYEGDKLKTMKVRMNEHDDTIPLENLQTLDEVWTYLQRFRIENGD